MTNALPRILVITTNVWRDEGSIHTLPDLFKCWDAEKIAQIYTRSVLPKTSVCENFFQISENLVTRSVLNREIKTGKRVSNDTSIDENAKKTIEAEAKLYAKARKKHSFFMSWCREIVWLIGKWKSQEMIDFIEDFNPDVFFIPIYPTIYMGLIQGYILRKFSKPAVCYLADDNYTYKSCGKNVLAYAHRFFLRIVVKKLINRCDKMFVISPLQKKEYDSLFGVDSIILTKGIDYANIRYNPKPLNKPIKMVYTGSLVVGRDKSLARISKTLAKINSSECVVELDIYSQDVAADKIMNLFNQNGCSFKGFAARSRIPEIHQNADIVVFVESLEPQNRKAARLSFSTKLTDYFKSGRCIFAIGDKDIAPIDYLIKEDAAIVATSYEEIEMKLKDLCRNASKIHEYGKKAFNCGKRNHNLKDVENRLKNTIASILTTTES